jgi:hypothetical protein
MKLLQKEGLRWMAEAEEVFKALQRALTSVRVLQLPAFDGELIVKCDASDSGFGSILHQGDGAIVFFNRQVTSWHAKLTAYERELIGLVQVV